jgi:CheY-specific phosphatase CheX
MEKEKIDVFFRSVEQAFIEVVHEMAGIHYKDSAPCDTVGSEKISIVVGMVGQNKGRILFETDAHAARSIAEGINGEPVEDEMEMYLFLSEFTNTFSGRAVTAINNQYKGTDLRLTPPAIFAGHDMEVVTPNIQTTKVGYTNTHGSIVLDIGFEGR